MFALGEGGEAGLDAAEGEALVGGEFIEGEFVKVSGEGLGEARLDVEGVGFGGGLDPEGDVFKHEGGFLGEEQVGIVGGEDRMGGEGFGAGDAGIEHGYGEGEGGGILAGFRRDAVRRGEGGGEGAGIEPGQYLLAVFGGGQAGAEQERGFPANVVGGFVVTGNAGHPIAFFVVGPGGAVGEPEGGAAGRAIEGFFGKSVNGGLPGVVGGVFPAGFEGFRFGGQAGIDHPTEDGEGDEGLFIGKEAVEDFGGEGSVFFEDPDGAGGADPGVGGGEHFGAEGGGVDGGIGGEHLVGAPDGGFHGHGQAGEEEAAGEAFEFDPFLGEAGPEVRGEVGIGCGGEFEEEVIALRRGIGFVGVGYGGGRLGEVGDGFWGGSGGGGGRTSGPDEREENKGDASRQKEDGAEAGAMMRGGGH